MDYGNTKTPAMHCRLGSATLSQLAFPGESNPNFPWEKSPNVEQCKRLVCTAVQCTIVCSIPALSCMLPSNFSLTAEAKDDTCSMCCHWPFILLLCMSYEQISHHVTAPCSVHGWDFSCMLQWDFRTQISFRKQW